MGQKRITIEVTEYQARVLRWTLARAMFVTPGRIRGRVFMQKLAEAHNIVQVATEGLDDLPIPKFPTRR